MEPSALARKLVIKPGDRMLVVNAPAGYLEAVTPLPEGASATDRFGQGFEVVQVFAADARELQTRLADGIKAVKRGGLLWVSYPKLSAGAGSDLSRDRVREAAQQRGWDTVSQVAVDDTWSALRIRPAGDVGRRGT
jgi:hypothetical protein